MFVSLMGIVMSFLLIACANVANLLLARAAHRSKEISIRVSLRTGAVFGLAPALHISKTNVNDVLKEAGRSGTSGVRARWTTSLLIGELALTLVLLSGACYMMRSLLALYTVEIGVDTSHLLVK